MHRIWAVAINTIRQVLRIKIAVVFVILLLVLLPVMAFSITGDGSIRGRLQTFVSYGLSLTSFLLCLLTIIISVFSLTSDVEQKQIFTVITKPIRRFELIFGKLLGVLLLDFALLAIFSALIYSATLYMPKYYKTEKAEIEQLGYDFFIARARLKMEKADVSKEAIETYKKLEKAQQLPPDVVGNEYGKKKFIDTITKRKELEKRAASVGSELLWKFTNVKVLDPNENLFIRFQYDVSVNPPDYNIYSRWVVGDDRQFTSGMPMQTPVYTIDRKDLIRTAHEIKVPAD
ncbi:MAG: ABC transporter permease, partial [Planctomycetota bacterium]